MKMTYYFLLPRLLPQIVYVGYLLLIISVFQVLGGQNQSAIIMTCFAVTLLIMRSWLRLDFQHKTISRFFAIFPYKTIKLQYMEKVLFTRKTVLHTYNSRANSSSYRLHEYEIWLRADGENHILQTRLDGKALLKKAEKIASAAGIPLDNRAD